MFDMDSLLRTRRTAAEWITFNRQLMKAHLALRGMTYEDLRIVLARIGFVDSEPNIRPRVGRGRYSAVFMLQCLRAMEIGHLVLPIDDVDMVSNQSVNEESIENLALGSGSRRGRKNR